MPRKKESSAAPATPPATDELTTWLQEHGVAADTETKIRSELGVETVGDLAKLNETDLTGIGMRPVPARKLLEAVAPATPAAGGMINYDDVLPPALSTESWLQALQAGGVVKVDRSTIEAATKAALAYRAGLFEVPKALVREMDAFTKRAEEQFDPEFYKLRQQLTRVTYANLFEAIPGLDGNYVTEARKKELFARMEEHFWTAVIDFHRGLKGWQEAWLGAGGQMAAMTMMAGFMAGGAAALPPGLMGPPDAGGLRDLGDAFANAINKVFAGDGVPITAALGYEAAKISDTLQNPRLPAMIGAPNRDMMLRQLGVAIPATYPRLETNLVRYVGGILQLKDTPAGNDETRLLGALYLLGTQISWDLLGDTGGKAGVTGIGGRL